MRFLIQIVKSTGEVWYKEKIGYIYDVEDFDQDQYIIQDEQVKENYMFILKEDCKSII